MAIESSQRHPEIREQTNFRPILVTGAHRSGTTWVGKMLASSNQVAYVSEPLNVWHRPGVMRTPTRYWYTYICDRNEADYLNALSDTIRLRYHAWEEIKSLRSLKDLMRLGRDWRIFQSGRFYRKRTLLKDPFAVFSAPWFYEALGCQVVIIVRHPVAFASSLKRLNWPFDFKNLLSQPLLMQDWLEPFQYEMGFMEQKGSSYHIEQDSIDPFETISRSCMLWRMLYLVVKEFQKRYPLFIVVRHEDLSIDPRQGFQSLYTKLGLKYTASIQRYIDEASSSENPKQVSKQKKYSVRLDSHSNLENWKYRLSKDEIRRIRSLTEDVADLYYPDFNWD